MSDDSPRYRNSAHDRFHGRIRGAPHPCAAPDCDQAGEFRAPGPRLLGSSGAGFDGPGEYLWFCLDHIRAFNAGYDYFAGMSADDILAAHHPLAGWTTPGGGAARAFRPTGSVDAPPRWADFADPLEAIAGRARARAAAAQPRADGIVLTGEQRRALEVLGLATDADRRALRLRYSELVRRYHPDRNGGDRSHEAALQAVVDAYQTLRRTRALG